MPRTPKLTPSKDGVKRATIRIEIRLTEEDLLQLEEMREDAYPFHKSIKEMLQGMAYDAVHGNLWRWEDAKK